MGSGYLRLPESIACALRFHSDVWGNLQESRISASSRGLWYRRSDGWPCLVAAKNAPGGVVVAVCWLEGKERGSCLNAPRKRIRGILLPQVSGT